MTTDYRALCVELLDELELWSSWHDATDLKDRAGAALHFTQPEPQPPAAIVEMVNKLHQINNPAIQPVVPTDEELLAMRSWSCHGPTFDSDLVDFGRRCYNLGRYGTPTPEAPNG
jgi:hypothetical protein